jgi:HKD family nuclease
MTVADRLRDNWKDDLHALLTEARESLVISSPYVSARGTDFVLAHLRATIKPTIQFALLTDLSPMNVAQGATDPGAVRTLAAALPHTRVFHLPRVHAKVYVGDGQTAIVTSGNLTAGGLDINYEYGLKVLDAPTAAHIKKDITDYAELGAIVPIAALSAYADRATELRRLYKEQERSVRRSDSRLRDALSVAADDLTRLRLARGPIHAVFAATIMYLLAKFGPLPTTELHPRIEAMHPDLCDNSVDRVIDGRRFGKKWKHAVRTAQQQLKAQGRIALVGDKWGLRRNAAKTLEDRT